MSSVMKLRSVVARGSSKLRSEARKWIEREGTAYIRREFNAADPRDAEPKITVASVMQYLDDREAPPGYTVLAADNAARYQVVRGVLEQAAQSGKLRLGTTVNTRGRQAQCFLPPLTPEAFSVVVDAQNAGDIESSLRTWLRANEGALRGVNGFLVVRGTSGA